MASGGSSHPDANKNILYKTKVEMPEVDSLQRDLAVLFRDNNNFYIIKTKSSSGPNEEKIDIKKLAEIYCNELSLTKKEIGELKVNGRSYRAHLDLLKNMRNGFSLEQVFNHPFHWNSKEKIDFICQAFDVISPEYKSKQNPNIGEISAERGDKYHLEDLAIFEGRKSWVEHLYLKQCEIKKANRNPKIKKRGITVGKTTIYDSILKDKDKDKEKQLKYDGNYVLELMRFFRNTRIHFWEKDERVQAAFESFNEGYWKFFDGRFPKFFMHVYYRMKECMRTTSKSVENFSPANSLSRTDMKKIYPID